MIAVSASAYKGMSGGPLCYLKNNSLYVEGIIAGSAGAPMGKFFTVLRTGFIQGNLEWFPSINNDIDLLVKL